MKIFDRLLQDSPKPFGFSENDSNQSMNDVPSHILTADFASAQYSLACRHVMRADWLLSSLVFSGAASRFGPYGTFIAIIDDTLPLSAVDARGGDENRTGHAEIDPTVLQSTN